MKRLRFFRDDKDIYFRHLFPFQTLTEIEKTNKNVNEQPLTHHLTV